MKCVETVEWEQKNESDSVLSHARLVSITGVVIRAGAAVVYCLLHVIFVTNGYWMPLLHSVMRFGRCFGLKFSFSSRVSSFDHGRFQLPFRVTNSALSQSYYFFLFRSASTTHFGYNKCREMRSPTSRILLLRVGEIEMFSNKNVFSCSTSSNRKLSGCCDRATIGRRHLRNMLWSQGAESQEWRWIPRIGRHGHEREQRHKRRRKTDKSGDRKFGSSKVK